MAEHPITPLPIPPDVTGVILFGGSFDPVTRAHVALAAAARDAVAPDAWLLFVPAERSPHKPSGPIASDPDRVAMLQTATRVVERCGVWTDEIDRARAGEPSYSVETLERAKRTLGHASRLWLLIGADQAAAFHRWREYRRILDLAEPIVLLRPPLASAEDLRRTLRESEAWSEREVERWTQRIAPAPVMEDAATRARALLLQGSGDREDLESLVDPAVLEVIERRGIYQSA